MKKWFAVFLLYAITTGHARSQEAFTITRYDVALKVNRDASLDISELIRAHSTEARHGIIREIPYRYRLQDLPSGSEKATRPMESNGYTSVIVEDVNVPGWKYEVSTRGAYKSLKIGSADQSIEGDQQFLITYRILNAIRPFFAATTYKDEFRF